MSRTRRRIDVETHLAVFTWVLLRLADAGLINSKTVGIDAMTLEANAALRSIVRRDSVTAVSMARSKTPLPPTPPDAPTPRKTGASRKALRHPRQSEQTAGVAEREELKETGLGSTARWCGLRRHRQANSVRVCSPTSRRVASLRPRSAGLTALTSAPRTLVQPGSCRQCPLIHPLHVVVAVLSRMTPFPATVDRQGPTRGPTQASVDVVPPRYGLETRSRPHVY